MTAVFSKRRDNDDDTNAIDEISDYIECRYVSPCDGAWRILGFPIMLRKPSVERLPFHLPNQQPIVFHDYESIDNVCNRSDGLASKFLAWFDANENYQEARELTYAQFPTKFVYHANERQWRPRTRGYSIGRLYFVAPGAGEAHYLRILLNISKGPRSFEDIRTIGETTYPSFKDACYALGLLDDDKEFVDAIDEASVWASGSYLRRLFASMLFSNSITCPLYVWERTWRYLSDDVLSKQRHLHGNPGIILFAFAFNLYC